MIVYSLACGVSASEELDGRLQSPASSSSSLSQVSFASFSVDSEPGSASVFSEGKEEDMDTALAHLLRGSQLAPFQEKKNGLSGWMIPFEVSAVNKAFAIGSEVSEGDILVLVNPRHFSVKPGGSSLRPLFDRLGREQGKFNMLVDLQNPHQIDSGAWNAVAVIFNSQSVRDFFTQLGKNKSSIEFSELVRRYRLANPEFKNEPRIGALDTSLLPLVWQAEPLTPVSPITLRTPMSPMTPITPRSPPTSLTPMSPSTSIPSSRSSRSNLDSDEETDDPLPEVASPPPVSGVASVSPSIAPQLQYFFNRCSSDMHLHFVLGDVYMGLEIYNKAMYFNFYIDNYGGSLEFHDKTTSFSHHKDFEPVVSPGAESKSSVVRGEGEGGEAELTATDDGGDAEGESHAISAEEGAERNKLDDEEIPATAKWTLVEDDEGYQGGVEGLVLPPYRTKYPDGYTGPSIQPPGSLKSITPPEGYQRVTYHHTIGNKGYWIGERFEIP